MAATPGARTPLGGSAISANRFASKMRLRWKGRGDVIPWAIPDMYDTHGRAFLLSLDMYQ